ncbi:hypothetical protein M9H77_10688 [Catharanthus roseus]|uniref:Uncharacterized protein n=1 Tax=Catharanthus roseus TaxID=4058 RepID=A0ACC0BCD1_CATRO|nr:hypothetical protein M9H77_10688 [Catharanthus roseus]
MKEISRGVVLCSILMVNVVFLGSHIGKAKAEGTLVCSPLELLLCTKALFNPFVKPSEICCLKLKEQYPCFCNYLSDPVLGPHFRHGEWRWVLLQCDLVWPDCAKI